MKNLTIQLPDDIDIGGTLTKLTNLVRDGSDVNLGDAIVILAAVEKSANPPNPSLTPDPAVGVAVTAMTAPVPTPPLSIKPASLPIPTLEGKKASGYHAFQRLKG
jgi:hypothetical protein